MASLLVWHLLGFYPGLSFAVCHYLQDRDPNSPHLQQTVPGTSELLVLSPMIPKYTVHNRYMNTSTTVKVDGYDAHSVRATIPPGAVAYVQGVRVGDGKQNLKATRCYIDFYDTFHAGANIVITLTSNRTAAQDCKSVPHSISTGGFATVR